MVGMLTSRLRRSFYNPVFRQPTGLEVVAGLETGLENDAQAQVTHTYTPTLHAHKYAHNSHAPHSPPPATLLPRHVQRM